MKNLVLSALMLCAAQAALASVPNCEALAEAAGAKYGVPAGLMSAIARKESGYSLSGTDRRAWPWALNHKGQSVYTQSEAEIAQEAVTLLARGETNFDLGCMQINYHWHGQEFQSVAQMIDPQTNVDYAAKYLSALKDQHGSWEAATQRYHSGDEARGQSYQRDVFAAVTPVQPARPTYRVVDPNASLSMVPEVSLARRSEVPRKLQQNWSKVEHFRDLLARGG